VHAVAESQRASTVAHLWLLDFRCFAEVDVALPPGLTVLHGENGQGKTSLLESVAWIARTRSFRGVADAMLVRASSERAVVRAEVGTGHRRQLFEAEIRATGRNRILCNRQPVARARDLHGLLRVTVFAPDDLALIKGGPADRRAYLDELLVALAPRYDAAQTDFERVLKQRNALLRGGVHDDEARHTLDVFDEQFMSAATEIVRGRLRLIERLAPMIEHDYCELAGRATEVCGSYETDWADESAGIEDGLRAALAARRRTEIDRGVTLVGPHRDEWRLTIGGLDARHQASQGEQRSLALALRLAGHAVVEDVTATSPVLLLDDVFSELDAARAAALVQNLPAGQTLLTTAGTVPPDVVPQLRLRIHDGRVESDEP
jgi:DNA replication and repair protein RecF